MRVARRQRCTPEVIAAVRSMGALGTIWEEIGAALNRSPDSVKQIWLRSASAEEKAARQVIRARDMRIAHAAYYERLRQEKKAADDLSGLPFSVCFEDSAEAVAERDPFPKFRAALFGASMPRSLSASTASWEAK